MVVIGEVLVEVSTAEGFASGTPCTLGFSGDALNSAAAAAAAGASVALLTRVADDEIGRHLLDRAGALGVDTSLVHLVPGQHGVYFVCADPGGSREFVYVRAHSAACGMEPADLDGAGIGDAGVVVASGVACAISESAAATVAEAARRARSFVYDPNYRPRLTTPGAAAACLRRLAPLSALVTPAWPAEAAALLGEGDALGAAHACLELGAGAAAVTRGAEGVLVLDAAGSVHELPALPPPALVDQTGAGDVLAGTIAARMALGDSLIEAVELATAAASLSLGGQGGTGYLPSLEESRAHLRAVPGVSPAGPAGPR